MNNTLIQTFDSIQEASKITNISYFRISNCCLGRNTTLGEYIWRYVE